MCVWPASTQVRLRRPRGPCPPLTPAAAVRTQPQVRHGHPSTLRATGPYLWALKSEFHVIALHREIVSCIIFPNHLKMKKMFSSCSQKNRPPLATPDSLWIPPTRSTWECKDVVTGHGHLLSDNHVPAWGQDGEAEQWVVEAPPRHGCPAQSKGTSRGAEPGQPREVTLQRLTGLGESHAHEEARPQRG